jgi:hypothetical protein
MSRAATHFAGAAGTRGVVLLQCFGPLQNAGDTGSAGFQPANFLVF